MANNKSFFVKSGLQTQNVSLISLDELNTMSMSMLNGGTLSFTGTSGQLFSITDSMSGTIFSVNDISGIPSIEVLDTGLVKLAELSGNVLIGTGTDNGVDRLQVATSAAIVGGTKTTAIPALNVTDTWNNAAATFSALKLNVTDTASNAASLLVDLQVGGASKFTIAKSGVITFAGHRLYSDANAICLTNSANVTSLIARSDYSLIPDAAYFGWGNLASFASDTKLYRDAAATLALRNGVNAQTFRVYNTYTDASNYERGFMRWNTNVLEIGSEFAGTGTYRDVKIKAGGATMTLSGGSYALTLPGNISCSQFYLGNVSGVGVALLNGSATTGAALDFLEMTAPASPAANNARIYAEDNGAGKTRLMVQFATGAPVQIAIEP